MCSKEEEGEESAYFDCLPDALLLLIFNKLHDLKSVTACLSVSKRFNALVPFTHTVFISVPVLKQSSSISYVNGVLRFFFLNLFLKPLRCFRGITAPPKSTTLSFDLSCCRKDGVLRIFKEMKSLHLELPGDGELGSSYGASFLRWKACFGSSLKTCIMAGAKSCRKYSGEEEREEFMEESGLNDDELKLRVIWTISCLISASTRHCMLKQILSDNPNIPSLERVVISDSNKQGTFCVGKEELVEMRKSINLRKDSSLSSPLPSMERSPVPELNVKLWYLPVLELPDSGYVMKGATLVLIKPVADGVIEDDGGDPLVGDEQPFSEAARKMIKVKKSYLMTMSSF